MFKTRSGFDGKRFGAVLVCRILDMDIGMVSVESLFVVEGGIEGDALASMAVKCPSFGARRGFVVCGIPLGEGVAALIPEPDGVWNPAEFAVEMSADILDWTMPVCRSLDAVADGVFNAAPFEKSRTVISFEECLALVDEALLARSTSRADGLAAPRKTEARRGL